MYINPGTVIGSVLISMGASVLLYLLTDNFWIAAVAGTVCGWIWLIGGMRRRR